MTCSAIGRLPKSSSGTASAELSRLRWAVTQQFLDEDTPNRFPGLTLKRILRRESRLRLARPCHHPAGFVNFVVHDQ